MKPAAERIDPALPIFRLRHGSKVVLYAPGCVAAASEGDGVPGQLRQAAEEAVAARRRLADAEFAPECLTVYLSNRCNMACGYCYAAGARRPPFARVDKRAALAAARLVAQCCAAGGKRFHLVLHGGGEPALEWERVVDLVEGTRRIADRASVGWHGFLATNGVLSRRQADWLASELDLIELSCDGPPEIQDRQRPLAAGAPSSPHVERTTGWLREAGARFLVRATITPATMDRQAEIVRYLHQALSPAGIRFEPVYRQGPDGFRPEDAERFAASFQDAQREARRVGCDLSISTPRLDEIHGPFCDVLRQALHLLPDGSAAACFFSVDQRERALRPIGRWDQTRDEYVLDRERIQEHRRKALNQPARCLDCVNVCHCALECPDGCAVRDSASSEPSFRCLVQRLLAEAWILETAAAQ